MTGKEKQNKGGNSSNNCEGWAVETLDKLLFTSNRTSELGWPEPSFYPFRMGFLMINDELREG